MYLTYKLKVESSIKQVNLEGHGSLFLIWPRILNLVENFLKLLNPNFKYFFKLCLEFCTYCLKLECTKFKLV